MKKLLFFLWLFFLPFVLLADNELQESISWMNQQWLTIFDSPDSFMSDGWLRRDEAAKFFVNYAIKVLNKEIIEDKDCSFKDANQARPDLKDVIIQACQLWLFQWYNWKFMPQEKLTNWQAITVFVRLIDGQKDESLWHFAKEYFVKANQLNLLQNTNLQKESNFDIYTTRWDVAKMLFKWKLNTEKKNSNKSKPKPDLDDSNKKIEPIVDNTPPEEDKIEKELKQWFSFAGDQHKTTDQKYLTKWTYSMTETFGYDNQFIVDIIHEDDINWKTILIEYNGSPRKTYFYVNKDWYYRFKITSPRIWPWSLIFKKISTPVEENKMIFEWKTEYTADSITNKICLVSGKKYNINSFFAWYNQTVSRDSTSLDFVVYSDDDSFNWRNLHWYNMWIRNKSGQIKVWSDWLCLFFVVWKNSWVWKIKIEESSN